MVFAISACDETDELSAPPEVQSQAIVSDVAIMGYSVPINIFVDGEVSTLKHSQVSTNEYTLDYIQVPDAAGEVASIEVFALTNREARIAWGLERNYPIAESYAFTDAVQEYVAKNKLPEDPELLTDAQKEAYDAFERELWMRHFEETGLNARSSGFLFDECNNFGAGQLQIINTKPFITQRQWRNRVSAMDAVVTVGRYGLQVYDRAWYAGDLGVFWEWITNQICLEGTRADNSGNSFIAY